MIEIVPLRGIGEVDTGDDLAALLRHALQGAGIVLRPGDVVVTTSKIVSKSEGRFACLNETVPSQNAVRLAELTLKDPRFVELVLAEAQAVVRATPNILITRHRLGFVMANSGIDASNLGPRASGKVLLLPHDPDASARRLSVALAAPVIVSDSFGRPWRMGVTNVAIGVAGLPALVDLRGERDRDGRVLEVTQVALADMIAAAAGLASGEAAEGVPAVLVRGFDAPEGEGAARDLIRPLGQDLFQ